MAAFPFARIVPLDRVRRFGLVLVAGLCAITLATTSSRAGVASNAASDAKISAKLSKRSFKSSQAGSVKLTYKFSRPSKSFSYRLTLKKGKKWVKVRSVKKTGTFKGQKKTTVKKIFGGKPVRVGSYKLKLSCDGGSRTLSFKVVRAPSGGSTGRPPTIISAPAITGQTQTTKAVQASTGTWTNSPISFAYQWFSCDEYGGDCYEIPGATSSQYTLTLDDYGWTVRVVVGASNSYGTGEAASAPSAVVTAGGPVPVSTALPKISGTPRQLETLSVSSNGTWTNSPTDFTYWWWACTDASQDDCRYLNTVSSSTYHLAIDDVGKVVGVTVVAWNRYGPGSVASDPTTVVKQAVSFQAHQDFSSNLTNSSSTGVAVGDFNGDGKKDLAVTNINASKVSVFLGTGTGSFGIASSYNCGSIPGAVVAGDFNGDGKQDLAVANQGDDNVSILLGTGTGSFGTATDFGVSSWPSSIAVGDFDGDSRQDLAVADKYSNEVSILLGTGTGSFGTATDFAVGSWPTSVAVGDFNGDNKQDLAVSNASTKNVSVLLGDGTGSFGTATNFAVGTSPMWVAVYDFSGDGKQDLAIANELSSNVSILLGEGTGSFGTATNFNAGSYPTSLAISDFDGDGLADIAVADENSHVVTVLMGIAGGSFETASHSFGVGWYPTTIAAADFNGDGKIDIASANEDSPYNLSVLINSTSAAP